MLNLALINVELSTAVSDQFHEWCHFGLVCLVLKLLSGLMDVLLYDNALWHHLRFLCFVEIKFHLRVENRLSQSLFSFGNLSAFVDCVNHKYVY